MEKLIVPELVSLDESLGDDKDAVIKSLAAMISNSGRAEFDGLVQDLMSREAKTVTGMSGGIAIPHCRSTAVKTGSLCFARLKEPVSFGAADGPADLIFMIAAAEGQDQEHLKLLQKLARKLVNKDFLATLRSIGTKEEIAQIITEVVDPEAAAVAPATAAPAAAPAAPAPASPASATSAAPAPAPAANATPATPEKYLVAVTSCPTGIAHTYMAADSLENTGKEMGIPVYVEAQGSGHVDRLDPKLIAGATAAIFAHDVAVTQPERFAHLPAIDVSVKAAIDRPKQLIEEALTKKKDPKASAAASATTVSVDNDKLSFGRKIQKAVLSGVSYMIPFVAAGGLLIALGFLIGGYDVAGVAQKVATENSLANLPGHIDLGDGVTTGRAGLLLYFGALFTFLGQSAMSFLVAALSGYIAYALAGRPGIAPGFVGGAISVAVGAGFIGGLVTGILAGLIAGWISSLKCPRWLAGLMPVAIVPLITTLIVGLLMLLLLGRPLAAIMTGLQDWLNSLSSVSAVLVGLVIGLMMCFDLGGPVNKAAYLFGTAGLSQGTDGAYAFMAAVMLAGMVPPLAMALSSAVRPMLYTPAERENGKAAWLLGLSFISEGAIPFAAADPLRVIPSMMAGGAVTGALSMLLGVGCRAPHGGIFVLFAYSNILGALVALVAGVIVGAVCITLAKMARKKVPAELVA